MGKGDVRRGPPARLFEAKFEHKRGFRRERAGAQRLREFDWGDTPKSATPACGEKAQVIANASNPETHAYIAI